MPMTRGFHSGGHHRRASYALILGRLRRPDSHILATRLHGRARPAEASNRCSISLGWWVVKCPVGSLCSTVGVEEPATFYEDSRPMRIYVSTCCLGLQAFRRPNLLDTFRRVQKWDNNALTALLIYLGSHTDEPGNNIAFATSSLHRTTTHSGTSSNWRILGSRRDEETEACSREPT
ncbi:hypothetical protein BDZ89DRAFT_1064085 [Hymenopellis radicata]|nr:hypothetical protein BDZ89DRAFT_1064085 [Hymenopellis radicata]